MADNRAARRPQYWQRHTDGKGAWRKEYPTGPPGAELAALRHGINAEPGSVPQMWWFYTTLSPDGNLSPRLRAEHLTLTLFAVHQQAQATPMHRGDIGVGIAIGKLRDHEKYSAEAVDRRFAAAATATSLAEVGMHLRGLVTQLRTIRQPLDYTQLFEDLRWWNTPERRARIRRRWGAQYFTGSSGAQPGHENPETSASSSTSPAT